MKHLVMTTLLALAVTAVAQTTPSSTQPQSATPSLQPSASSTPPQDMPGSATASQSAGSDKSKTEKLKGCIQSNGGQYMLEDKHGKQVTLTGQDFSAHVGHTVTVHGAYADGSTGVSANAVNGGKSSGQQFVVSKMDMVSEQCGVAKSKTKGMNFTHTDSKGKPSPYRY
jgi:hypothetical protein